MTAIQQVLIHHSSSSGIQPDGNGPTLGPPNSCFVTHGDDRVSNANNDHPCFGIPDHSWQTNGTHMVSDGADWLIPDHRNYNKVIVIGRGTSTSSGGYPDQVGNIGTLTGEQSAMLTQDQGVNWSESGLNMHNYTSNTNWTTWYDWATNGSMSDPVWIAVGGGFPSSAGYQGDGNNIAIYKSTNFTDWTRILVTPDYTYGDQGNQFISCICYSNGTWIIGNDPTGSICTSTDDGATWSNWYTVSGAYLDAYTIASNNGGSKVMMAIQENHPTHNKSIYYSSDSGATWDSGHEFKPGDFGVVINNIQYFDKQIKEHKLFYE